MRLNNETFAEPVKKTAVKRQAAFNLSRGLKLLRTPEKRSRMPEL